MNETVKTNMCASKSLKKLAERSLEWFERKMKIISEFLYDLFFVGRIESRIYDSLCAWCRSCQNDKQLKEIIQNESYICRFCENNYECWGHKRRKIGSDHCVSGVKEWMKVEGIMSCENNE